MADVCKACGRVGHICRSTRDMEDASGSAGNREPKGDPICFAALMMLGGGEYSHNQAMAARLRRGWNTSHE